MICLGARIYQVPGSKVIVQAGGFDVALNLPNTRLDLGSMPSVSATLNTDSTDVQVGVMSVVDMGKS